MCVLPPLSQRLRSRKSPKELGKVRITFDSPLIVFLIGSIPEVVSKCRLQGVQHALETCVDLGSFGAAQDTDRWPASHWTGRCWVESFCNTAASVSGSLHDSHSKDLCIHNHEQA